MTATWYMMQYDKRINNDQLLSAAPLVLIQDKAYNQEKATFDMLSIQAANGHL